MFLLAFNAMARGATFFHTNSIILIIFVAKKIRFHDELTDLRFVARYYFMVAQWMNRIQFWNCSMKQSLICVYESNAKQKMYTFYIRKTFKLLFIYFLICIICVYND